MVLSQLQEHWRGWVGVISMGSPNFSCCPPHNLLPPQGYIVRIIKFWFSLQICVVFCCLACGAMFSPTQTWNAARALLNLKGQQLLDAFSGVPRLSSFKEERTRQGLILPVQTALPARRIVSGFLSTLEGCYVLGNYCHHSETVGEYS